MKKKILSEYKNLEEIFNLKEKTLKTKDYLGEDVIKKFLRTLNQ